LKPVIPWCILWKIAWTTRTRKAKTLYSGQQASTHIWSVVRFQVGVVSLQFGLEALYKNISKDETRVRQVDHIADVSVVAAF